MTRLFRSQLGRCAAAAAGLIVALATGCTYSHGDPAAVVTPCDASATTSTYAAVVQPIFAANCYRCHATSVFLTLGGGNDFGSYATLKAYVAAGSGSRRLLGCIRQDPALDLGYPAMPQGSAPLSTCDVARIKAWLDAGAPNN